MLPLPYSLARSFLFGLDAEKAHELTLATLAKFQNTPLQALWSQPRVQAPITIAGLTFPNRVGLAAGLDKNGHCIDGFAAMGFGFIEVGTVTPKPQAGNAKPRLFRLPQAQALINRFGFNNEGLESFIQHIQQARFRSQGGILGLNIGKNAATPIEQAAQDYLIALEGVLPYADYVTVNISSPNTQNLRSLQSDAALDDLLGRLQERRLQRLTQLQRQVPLFVKIAPDLDTEQIHVIAASLKKNAIDGVIATNTTLSRVAVQGLQHADEVGGLSGQPVFEASNQVIQELRRALGATYPIIGVGGIGTAQQALAKIRAGADLIQIYTGLIYQGPKLVSECAKALAHHL